MVTAEVAVLLPALVLLLVLALRAVAVGVAEVACVDAARVAARSAARGDPLVEARAQGLRQAPHGASVVVRVNGGEASVEVRAAARLLPGVSLPLLARASARLEGSP